MAKVDRFNESLEAGPLIGAQRLSPEDTQQYERQQRLPVKALQIGEGNFLRGFADWMLQTCNSQGLWNGSVAVTQPRPTGKPNLDRLKAQDGIYTLLVRGLRDGKQVTERTTISVFSRMIDPYEEWEAFLRLAEIPELEVVISNTTEAGLTYVAGDWQPERPVLSFPGKLTAFLYRRYTKFGGDPAKGLLHLPCELLDHNGDRLRDIVLQHADDWGLPAAFKAWVRESNRFLNSLVDRIVTGFPAGEADGLFAEWGYRDPLLTTAEPYHLWAIEGEPELDAKLPLAAAGLNVHWVDDLAPYQLRKVRILNGTHTMMAAIGLVNGLQEVREALAHPVWGPVFIKGLFDEIVPGVPLGRQDMTDYANATLERFRNPFIRHKLADIAMNSLSKWKVRVLPSVKAHLARTGEAPPVLSQSLASLLRLYRPAADAGEQMLTVLPDGTRFTIRDDPAHLAKIREIWSSAAGDAGGDYRGAIMRILGLVDIWGEDLTRLPGLANEVVRVYAQWEGTDR